MNLLLNKTKIVATIGPASASKEILRELILAGMNVARINFSHGTQASHQTVIRYLKELDEELSSCTTILGDIQGPKLRIGEVAGNKVRLIDGGKIVLTDVPSVCTEKSLFIHYSNFFKDVQPGDQILIDDGKIILEVLRMKEEHQAVAKIIQGGVLGSRKGINLPDTRISLPCLTEKDKRDVRFALQNNLPWLALSFVRSASDVLELKKLIRLQNKNTLVISKIEKPQAIEHLDEIIAVSDGVMVARGDLGVEIPLQDVPLIQKDIVAKCRIQAKPVIIATQMMESMTENMTPTRAEVNDVANAVTDSADAVMLSSETSVGHYPVEVVKTMYNIITRAEKFEGIYKKESAAGNKHDERYITDSICSSACRIADSIGATAIIANTFSGYSCFKLASSRPYASIIAFTANKKILRIINLIWGVRGFYYDKFISTDSTIYDIKNILIQKGLLQKGNLIINITSMPIQEKGMSNMLKISRV